MTRPSCHPSCHLTLAVTTLLKTGSEGSVDKLLKQIGGFMGEITDDFKIVVVEVRERELGFRV